DPKFAVLQQENELGNVSLVWNGLLGCTPTALDLTITFQCLELYHQFIQAYSRVLCALHGVTYQPHFQEQSSMTFDVYLSIQCSIQAHMDQALGHSDPNWHLQHLCPACIFKQPGEPILIPSSLKAMDGNNSAKQMAHAGHADCCVFPSTYMILKADVNIFKNDVCTWPDQHGNTEHQETSGCADTWQAASPVDKDTVKVFEQTGIFLSACKHGMILTCAEMVCSGELYMFKCNVKCMLTDPDFLVQSIPWL
ncbi:hypothetical protein EDC04DRAFT_2586648, partial [Pisolithus marmoratus]